LTLPHGRPDSVDSKIAGFFPLRVTASVVPRGTIANHPGAIACSFPPTVIVASPATRYNVSSASLVDPEGIASRTTIKRDWLAPEQPMANAFTGSFPASECSARSGIDNVRGSPRAPVGAETGAGGGGGGGSLFGS